MDENYFKAQTITGAMRDCFFLRSPADEMPDCIRNFREQVGLDRASADKFLQDEAERLKYGTMSVSLGKHQVAHGDEIIRKAIDENFKGATHRERAIVAEQIAKEVFAPNARYSYPLSHMLAGGLTGLRSRARKRLLWAICRHSWAGFMTLLAIVGVIGIFARVTSDFETIVVSLLLLACTFTMRLGTSSLLSGADFNYADLMRYFSIRRNLGFLPSEDESEGKWKNEEQLKLTRVRYYITDAGRSIINLIVFWHLFRLLLAS